MKAWAFTALKKASLVSGLALAWVVIFKLNMFVFSQLEHSSRAHWIFLPAALRVLWVLLFAEEGVLGLVLGAYLTLPHDASSSLAYEMSLAVSSGLGPLIAIWLCRQIFPIASDLVGLRGRHVIALSIAGAGANSVMVNGCMAIAGRWHGDVAQIATIFVGDLNGTAIVLLFLSTTLSFAARRSAWRVANRSVGGSHGS
jgi:hypothetical protein